jgi:hypothetical protein
MKKATKVLIIIAVVSLVLGTILSIVSLLLMRNAGWETVKEWVKGNDITWEVSDWRSDYDEDSEDVYVKGPFFEVDVQGEDVYVDIFGITIEVEDGQGRVYSNHNAGETETTVPMETLASDASEE